MSEVKTDFLKKSSEKVGKVSAYRQRKTAVCDGAVVETSIMAPVK